MVGSAKVANRFGLELIPIDGVLALGGVPNNREVVVTEGRIGAFPLSFDDTEVVDVDDVDLADKPLVDGLAGRAVGCLADGPA